MYKKFDKQIDELIAQMTLREKIGQLNQPIGHMSEQELIDMKDAVRKGEVGSILLAECATAGNDPQGRVNTELYNELQRVAVEESRLGIPMIFGLTLSTVIERCIPYRLQRQPLLMMSLSQNAIVTLPKKQLPTAFIGPFHLCLICATTSGGITNAPHPRIKGL